MKKSFLSCTMMLCMVFSLSAAAMADGADFTEKTVTVYNEGIEDGEFALRFYNETPNVPYMGICEYSELMKHQPLTLRENEDGTCVVSNETGEELFCDAANGLITVNNWGGFFDLPLPLEDEALGWKDTSTHFIRFTDVEYEGDPAPVELDFAGYGIHVYSDENDIYLPVSTLSNIMTDIATNHLLYNGEALYRQRFSLDGSSIEGLYNSEVLKAEAQGTRERPLDIVKQSYADLCFSLDYFFGHPGKAKLDAAIAEKGLDGALTDLGKKGASIKKGLLSPSLSSYMSAMNELFFKYLSDGHTLFTSGTEFMNMGFAHPFKLSAGYFADILESPNTISQLLNELIVGQRADAWGDDVYREYGNTAIIRLDSFMPDEEAWESYYNGEGDFPEDPLGIVVSGLRKADENPDIKNVIFDLSCNSGGSPDVLMAILAMTTGQNQLYGIHKLTGQDMTFTFETDTNFDGVYDEKDKEVHYDFNYGVLTTRHAFSCGNLFPFIAREGGAVIIGEPSSGGSCCIQAGSDAEGFRYMMSSAQWQLRDLEGDDLEAGCPVDIPIEAKSNRFLNAAVSLLNVDEAPPSYDQYFDDKVLDELMNEWFAGEEALDAAA